MIYDQLERMLYKLRPHWYRSFPRKNWNALPRGSVFPSSNATNVSQTPMRSANEHARVVWCLCYGKRKRPPRVSSLLLARARDGDCLQGAGATKTHTPLTVRKTVQEIQSSAICNERKQTPRIRVSHRKHPKPWSPKKPISCLGCKRSRVQISAARPKKSIGYMPIQFENRHFVTRIVTQPPIEGYWSGTSV